VHVSISLQPRLIVINVLGMKRPRRDVPLNSDSNTNKRDYNATRTLPNNDPVAPNTFPSNCKFINFQFLKSANIILFPGPSGDENGTPSFTSNFADQQRKCYETSVKH
jgi:hypothetical protein